MSTINVSLVNNLPFPPFINQKKYDELVDFPLRQDDVFITTLPKSGSTWMQQIAKLIKHHGEVGSDHIYDSCPWFEMIGKDAAMVRQVINDVMSLW